MLCALFFVFVALLPCSCRLQERSHLVCVSYLCTIQGIMTNRGLRLNRGLKIYSVCLVPHNIWQVGKAFCHKPDEAKIFFCYSDLCISSSCSTHAAAMWAKPCEIVLWILFIPRSYWCCVLHAGPLSEHLCVWCYWLLCLTTMHFIHLVNWTKLIVVYMNHSSIALLIIPYTLTEILNKLFLQ